jgi:hypothetical protein
MASVLRKFKPDLEGIDLNTIEGQQALGIEIENALTRDDLTAMDLKYIKLLQDSIKIQKDIDAVKTFGRLFEEIQKLKARVDKLSL